MSTFTYNFIQEIMLNPENIKNHYGEDYKYKLFNNGNEGCDKVFNDFKNMVSKRKFNYHEHMRLITAGVVEYLDDEDFGYFQKYLIEKDDCNLLMLYATYIADEIIEKYENYINDVTNNTTAKRIAINKLKRNKIANWGILLKISMKESGMF